MICIIRKTKIIPRKVKMELPSKVLTKVKVAGEDRSATNGK